MTHPKPGTLNELAGERQVAPILGAEPRRWELVLPYTKPPLTLNSRPGNFHAHARIVKRLRVGAHTMATVCRMPKGLDHVRITLTYVPADTRTRDRSNLQPTLKALVDGLALGKGKVKGYGLVVDDDDSHVTERIEIADKGPAFNDVGSRLKLTIEEIAQ